MNSTIEQLVRELDLGELDETPQKITGGLLHVVYKVITSKGVYVVKRLNHEVANCKSALANIEKSERVALSLEKHISLIPAIVFNNDVVVQQGNAYFIIYQWQAGEPIYSGAINDNHCKKIGSILGKIHSLGSGAIKATDLEISENNFIDWGKYLSLGRQSSVEWLKDLQSIKSKLCYWQKCAIEAQHLLVNHQVISHRDLDPKNVLWHQNKPYFNKIN